MENNQQQGGIVLNTKTIGALVGIITLIGSFFAVVDKVSAFNNEINMIKFSQSRSTEDFHKIVGELKILNQKMDIFNQEARNLTIEIREMKAVEGERRQGLIMNQK